MGHQVSDYREKSACGIRYLIIERKRMWHQVSDYREKVHGASGV